MYLISADINSPPWIKFLNNAIFFVIRLKKLQKWTQLDFTGVCFFWSASPHSNQFALEIHYTLPPFFIEIFFPMPKEDYFRFHERFFATGADSWEFSSFFIYHFRFALNQSYLDYFFTEIHWSFAVFAPHFIVFTSVFISICKLQFSLPHFCTNFVFVWLSWVKLIRQRRVPIKCYCHFYIIGFSVHNRTF